MKSKNYVPPGSDVGGGAKACVVYNPHKKRSGRSHAVVPTRSNGASHTPSQATGVSKGIRPSSLAKWMCSHNRSYRHPEYAQVMSSLDSRKGKK